MHARTDGGRKDGAKDVLNLYCRKIPMMVNNNESPITFPDPTIGSDLLQATGSLQDRLAGTYFRVALILGRQAATRTTGR